MTYKISDEQEQLIAELAEQGMSGREIARHAGIDKNTVFSRLASRNHRKRAAPQSSGNVCDFCGEPISRAKEADRRTARTSRRFCDSHCYGAFQQEQRNGDCCRLCGATRGEAVSRIFSNGMCQRCYESRRLFPHDPEMALAHSLNKRLKREVRYAERRLQQRQSARSAG